MWPCTNCTCVCSCRVSRTSLRQSWKTSKKGSHLSQKSAHLDGSWAAQEHLSGTVSVSAGTLETNLAFYSIWGHKNWQSHSLNVIITYRLKPHLISCLHLLYRWLLVYIVATTPLTTTPYGILNLHTENIIVHVVMSVMFLYHADL